MIRLCGQCANLLNGRLRTRDPKALTANFLLDGKPARQVVYSKPGRQCSECGGRSRHLWQLVKDTKK